MLNVLSDTGVSTVPPAGADAELRRLRRRRWPSTCGDLRKPTAHTSTAIDGEHEHDDDRQHDPADAALPRW